VLPNFILVYSSDESSSFAFITSEQMGLRIHVYWLTMYLYDMLLYLAVLAIVILLSLAFQFAIITHGRYGVAFHAHSGSCACL
jgi:hypothetical protein